MCYLCCACSSFPFNKKRTKLFALAQFVLGVILLTFGICDLPITGINGTPFGGFGSALYGGCWIGVTGIIGIGVTSSAQPLNKKCWLKSYYVACLLSSFLSGNVCGHYITMSVMFYEHDKLCNGKLCNQRMLTFTGFVVAVGLLEWVVSIYSSVLCGRGVLASPPPPQELQAAPCVYYGVGPVQGPYVSFNMIAGPSLPMNPPWLNPPEMELPPPYSSIDTGYAMAATEKEDFKLRAGLVKLSDN